MKKVVVIVEKSKCHPGKCQHECMKYDPVNRSGGEGFHLGPDGKSCIDENIATDMHKISAKKCPFHAITIVRLPEQLKEDPLHRYGSNQFMIYGLPLFKENKVIGIIGRNGTGKTTALNILSNTLTPNLGSYDENPDKKKVIEKYSKISLGNYFKNLYNKEIKFSYKPQRVELLNKFYKGKVIDLIKSVDEKNQSEKLMKELELENIKDRNLDELSGGELQRVAILAAYLKKADFYFFDEPSSFLDIKNRIKAAKLIRKLAEDSSVIVIEHDLATLDYVSDEIQIVYGEPGAYGIFSQTKGISRAINEYLEGYLKEENIRYRNYSIKFNPLTDRKTVSSEILYEIPRLEKSFQNFKLDINEFKIFKGQVLAIMGQNGLGKSTFLNLITGNIKPDNKNFEVKEFTYKRQDLETSDLTVKEYIRKASKDILDDRWYKANVIEKLDLERLFEEPLKVLSGGELQKVNIASSLTKDVRIILMDEPTAFIDIEDRIKVAEIIKEYVIQKGASAIIVDHDIQFVDYLSDSMLVFEGTPGKEGKVFGPFKKKEGMNRILKNLGITYRKDPETNRARINKEGSQLDMIQKKSGEYY
ncbi:ribosome biogenesis/translation initiation ATPase RLI [Candidatus Woesearchaeota archaeon]|nr:ribosome biogenesis/translation initiation ATPase RLI [Candidatus Woesearchaeota archaeon]